MTFRRTTLLALAVVLCCATSSLGAGGYITDSGSHKLVASTGGYLIWGDGPPATARLKAQHHAARRANR